MNVGELKQILKNVPDDYDVTIVMHNAVEAFWRSLDEMRTGWRGLIAYLVDPVPKGYEDSRKLHSWAASAGIVMWKGKSFGEFRIANGYHCPSIGGKNDQPQEEDQTQLQLASGKGVVRR
jgi:hypothetical protein